MKTLFSFFIAFAFVTTLFGQEARTSPVISTSKTDIKEGKIYKVIYVDENTVKLLIKKSVDCAILTNISASSDGEPVKIVIDKNEFKKLNTETVESITVTIQDGFEKNIDFKLQWNLKGCKTIDVNDNSISNPKGRSNSSPAPTYLPEDVIRLNVKKNKVKKATDSKGTSKN